MRVKKYLPVRGAALKCILLTGILLCVYFLDNSFMHIGISGQTYNYILKPAVWIGIALIVWLLPKAYPKAKLRLKSYFVSWALNFAIIFVVISVIAGMIDGFGKSPYSTTLEGMAINILLVGSALIGRELIRNYFVNTLTKDENFTVFIIIALFMTLTTFPLNTFYRLNEFEDITIFTAQYFAPEFAKNFFATYLAFLGGPIASITYLGILDAVHWLSPILPNLKWITTALIGVLCPIFSLIVLQNMYLKESRKVRRQEKDKQSPAGWIITSLISISIVWFAVGVFPVYPSVIATGSMEPMIKPGDVILVNKTVDKSSLTTGDVIQFKRDNILISHRIVEVVEDDQGWGYRTKGDNNSGIDSEIVRFERIKGEIIRVVPKIGRLTLLIKSEKHIQIDEVEF